VAPPRLRRFLHLERARPGAPEGDAGLPSPERFGGKPTPTTAPDQSAGSGRAPFATRTDASAGRSEVPPVAGRFLRPDLRAPDVAPVPAGAQPFVRCMRCETDASLYATRCETCGEPLDTPAQRAFNERLWAERRRAAGEEDRALAEARAGREKGEAEAARARREMGELLAAETARRERDRLDVDASRDGWGGRRWGRGGWGDDDGWDGGDPRPLGLRLLALVTNPRWRIGIAAGALAAALVAGFLAFRAGSLLGVYAVVGVFAVLFSPRRRRRRWWR
jgi:hypothetical protein